MTESATVGHVPREALQRRAMDERVQTAVILAGIILAGAVLRLVELGDIPLGFHIDEGRNARDALRIAEGWRPIFLPNNNGREPLFMYLMAGTIDLFGPSIWAARLAGVLAGLAAIAAQYLLVRDLPVARPRLTALVSASVVAITFWPVAQARYALRANLLPVWVALLVWAWWRALTADGIRPPSAWRSPAVQWSAAAGAFLAAALYTHLTGRLLPAILILSAALIAIRRRSWRPIALTGIALAAAALLSLPLARYFQQHPEMFDARASQVSVFNPEVHDGDLSGTLVENAWHLVLAPILRGDTSWYHNLSQRPVFDPLLAISFLAGIGLLLYDLTARRGRHRWAAAVLLVLVLVVAVVPSWLSVGAPNYVRLTGVWPVLFLLPAWGLVRGAIVVDERVRPGLGATAIAVVLVLSAAWTVRDYFGTYAQDPRVYHAFTGDAVERGRHLAREIAAGPTYVSPPLWNQSVIRFMAAGSPPAGALDMAAGLVLPPAGNPAYVFDPVEAESVAAFEARWPQAQPFQVRDSRGQISLLGFRLDRSDWPISGRPLDVDFGGHIRLQVADASPIHLSPGDTLTVTFEWLAVAPTELDHNFFVHLVTEDDVLGDELTIAQFDGPALGGSHTTDLWTPGERILQSVDIPIPDDAPLGPVTIRTGWYDWRTGERLPIPGDDDAAADFGRVEITE